MSRVFGRIWSARSALPRSQVVNSIPNLGSVSVTKWSVPPYKSVWNNAWSPARSSPKSVVEMAAMPLAKTSPASALSRAAIFAPTAAIFGTLK